jgi:uncharacterized Zn-binding protein involved in type VI secretion
MAGEIIRKGDPTSHGGVVLEGSLSDICMGKPIAYIGHKVQCPKCKGVFPIIEGVFTTTFYGKGVALAGMKTACGAVLVATQFTDIVEQGGGGGASSVAAASTAAARSTAVASTAASLAAGVADAAPNSQPEAEVFDEQYAFVDEKQPLGEIPYTVKLPSGEFFHGVTDPEGRTERFVTDGAQQLEIYIGHHSS